MLFQTRSLDRQLDIEVTSCTGLRMSDKPLLGLMSHRLNRRLARHVYHRLPLQIYSFRLESNHSQQHTRLCLIETFENPLIFSMKYNQNSLEHIFTCSPHPAKVKSVIRTLRLSGVIWVANNLNQVGRNPVTDSNRRGLTITFESDTKQTTGGGGVLLLQIKSAFIWTWFSNSLESCSSITNKVL